MTIVKANTLALLILIASVTISQGETPQGDNSSQRFDKIEKRLNELKTSLDLFEKRLAKIEESLRPLIGQTSSSEPAEKQFTARGADSTAIRLVEVKIANKRYQASDPHSGRYEDYIWYDATYVSKLKKKTRSVKGIMQFCDLFGEPKFQIRVTINDPIEPDQEITTAGVGFKYNQFLDTHKWMLATSLDDMTFRYKVESALYADGTTEDF